MLKPWENEGLNVKASTLCPSLWVTAQLENLGNLASQRYTLGFFIIKDNTHKYLTLKDH